MANDDSTTMPDDVAQLLKSNLTKEEKMNAARKGNMPMPLYCEVPDCGVELTQNNSTLPESCGRHSDHCKCDHKNDDGSIMHSFSYLVGVTKVCNHCLETTDATEFTCNDCRCVLFEGSYTERGKWLYCQECNEDIEERCGPIHVDLKCPTCEEIGEISGPEGDWNCSKCEHKYMKCMKCNTVSKLNPVTVYTHQNADDVARKIRFWAELSSIGEGKEPVPEEEIEQAISDAVGFGPFLDEKEMDRIISEFPNCYKTESGYSLVVPNELTKEIGITMNMSPGAYWFDACESCGAMINFDLHWDEGF